MVCPYGIDFVQILEDIQFLSEGFHFFSRVQVFRVRCHLLVA